MKTGEISMLGYIQETPYIVKRNISESQTLTGTLVEMFLARRRKRVCIVACGSSYNAAVCAQRYMRSMLGIQVEIIPPFTFNYYEHDLNSDDFVLCMSQSGCSTNTLESLRLCKAMGIPAIGVTGNVHSDFEKEADVVVDIGLYGEKLDFVTKGVVAQTAFLELFALHAAQGMGHISSGEVLAQKAEMMKAMENYDTIVQNFPPFFERNKKELLSMHVVYCIGAGSNYGTALEGAVKIGETVHIPAIGYEVEEAIHGPQIQLTPDYTFVFLDPGDVASTRIEQFYRAACAITDRVYILTNNPNIAGPGAFRVPHQIAETLSPLYSLAFVQMLACSVAQVGDTWRTHPLLKDFKAILNGKSAAYVAYDCT